MKVIILAVLVLMVGCMGTESATKSTSCKKGYYWRDTHQPEYGNAPPVIDPDC